MSPRSPPKISLRHDWTKELGSKVARQPEGEIARQAKFFQPTQPIPSPNCDRSGQLDITQDVISVQTRSSEDSKSLNVEQTHDRSGQPDKHIVAVQDDPEENHEVKTLNTDNETIRERIEEDMDFNSRTTTFYRESSAKCQRSRIDTENREPPESTCSSTRPTTDSFNPFSPESKQMIHEVGNIELCELLNTEPKTQCKVCLSYWDIGIVYCTCGHFLRKGREENQKFIKYTMDLLSIPDYYIKKGQPHGHRYGKKPGDKEYYIANQLKKKRKK